MKKVIVTGANGFLGSMLVSRLIQKGKEVIAIDRDDCSHIVDSTLVTKIKCSLSNVDEMMEAIPSGEYDALYHFAWAGVNGEAKADPLVQLNNVNMTINCAILSHHLKVKKLLCAGTIAERVVDSLTELKSLGGSYIYGVAKHTAHLLLEAYCKSIGQDFIWMQFSNIYGPLNKTGNLISYTINRITGGAEATFGPANQMYDFIYIDDLIEAAMRLGEKDTKKDFYFIGSGQPRLLRDYLNEIGKLSGHEKLVKIGVRPDDGVKYSINMFDITDLEEDIGDYVNTSFKEGIKRTLSQSGIEIIV